MFANWSSLIQIQGKKLMVFLWVTETLKNCGVGDLSQEMLKASERSFERPVERPQAGGSLAFLMDSYSSEARKRERSGSDSPPAKFSRIEDTSPPSRLVLGLPGSLASNKHGT
jgi:hypothetical protein